MWYTQTHWGRFHFDGSLPSISTVIIWPLILCGLIPKYDNTSLIFIRNGKIEYPVIVLKIVKQWFKVFQQTLK